MVQTPVRLRIGCREMNAHLVASVPKREIPKFDHVAGRKGFIPQLCRDERLKADALPGSLQAEDNILHHRKVARDGPKLATGIDDRTVQACALYLSLSGHEVVVLHVGKVEGGEVLQERMPWSTASELFAWRAAFVQ